MTDTVPTKQNNKLHLGGQRRKQLPAFLLPALLSAEKDAKIKQLKNHTGRSAQKRKMDDKIKNTSKPGVAYYHLPGLFEFYGLYRMFLPLFYHHREYFYNWCAIGSIYGALGDASGVAAAQVLACRTPKMLWI